MKRYSIFISLLLCVAIALLSSCSSSSVTGTTELPAIIPIGGTTQKVNMQIDFGKKHFSGLLIARRMDSGEVRLVFTTHFGLSVFDFSLYPDSMHVNSIVEPMRKKKIIRLLEKDFRLVFQPARNVRIKEKSSIFEKRISGRGLTKTVITLSEFTNGRPQRINIKHPWKIIMNFVL